MRFEPQFVCVSPDGPFEKITGGKSSKRCVLGCLAPECVMLMVCCSGDTGSRDVALAMFLGFELDAWLFLGAQQHSPKYGQNFKSGGLYFFPGEFVVQYMDSVPQTPHLGLRGPPGNPARRGGFPISEIYGHFLVVMQ